MSAAPGAVGKKSGGRTIAAKALIIQEFKRRLRDNVKSLNDNFFHIINAAKVTEDASTTKSSSGKMTEFFTAKNEMAVRAALMVRAADELYKLTNELKEFLVLHDFNFLTQAERECDEALRKQTSAYTALRLEVAGINMDIDRELSENFNFLY
ncbi:unnamed protein product [Caenorhabditis auriculariae]|uniref:Mediator of RNA polymerase II transcription subunit 22 n=1 Tax=Caenorhabditis auriculariae TaxID=2777116 RepID=A0A8S1HT59_9PELO|nr:unnamed protein product [Caenorhabditis auriculariae]